MTYPDFIDESDDRIRAALLRIRAAYLKHRNPLSAAEAVCDLVASEYRHSGHQFINTKNDNEVIRATLALMLHHRFIRTVSEQSRKLNPPDTTVTIDGHEFPNVIRRFLHRFQRTLDRYKAEALEEEANRIDHPARQPESSGNEDNQGTWLKQQLTLRGWTTGDLQLHGGPDRKTSEAFIAGKTVTPGSLKKIVDGLNLKPIDGLNIDILEVSAMTNTLRKP